MKIHSLKDCKIIDLPKITDSRGSLTFVEGENHVPFGIKRVFYLYEIPADADRGAHALKNCHQILIAVTGSFDVIVDDGIFKKRIHLNKGNQGLLIPSLIWREMEHFTPGSVCLVLASERYNETDYYREYEDFVAATNLTRI